MKKIGLITLNGYVNYGNRLQNYALQEVLKSYGYEVDTIWVNIKRKESSDFTFNEKIKNILNSSPKDNIDRITNKITGVIYKNKLNRERQSVFKDFSNNFLNETTYKIAGNEENLSVENEYDFFVTGSDQVWNPHFRRNDSAYFLTFVPEAKRIAYAPSFGVDEIPDEYKELYREWINDIPNVSVREEKGAEIIKELTGREAPVLVDPTLLLDRDRWLSIAKTLSNKPKSKYLLTYFLGEVSLSTKRYIKSVAKKNDLQVINLAKESDRVPYLSGPSEFIDYINNAKLFFTDSFHGGVFSIILETPFVIFDRKGKSPSMNSRIITLLSKFDYEQRHINKINTNDDLFNIKFKHVESILKEERDKAFNYLSEALEVN